MKGFSKDAFLPLASGECFACMHACAPHAFLVPVACNKEHIKL